MKIATWNVNSIRARVEHLVKFIGYAAPDVLCLQETKVVDGDFPRAPFAELGYRVLAAGQKSYNGVAILSRVEGVEAAVGFPHLGEDHPLNSQKRLIHSTFDGVRVVNGYFPNGEEVGSDKYAFKLEFLSELKNWLSSEAARFPELVLCGDFNVAPEDRDLWDPEERAGTIFVSEPEREGVAALRDLGLVDCFRLHHSESGRYSWWDFRGALFWKGRGMRLDHLYATKSLAEKCAACDIDERPRKWKQPSDHTPVWAQFTA